MYAGCFENDIWRNCNQQKMMEKQVKEHTQPYEGKSEGYETYKVLFYKILWRFRPI
jgi:hypothetical protein